MPQVADDVSRNKILNFYRMHLENLPDHGPQSEYKQVALLVSEISSKGYFSKVSGEQFNSLIKYFEEKLQERDLSKQNITEVYDLLTLQMWQQENSRETILSSIDNLEFLSRFWRSFLRFNSLLKKPRGPSEKPPAVNPRPLDILYIPDYHNLRRLNYLQMWIGYVQQSIARDEGKKLKADNEGLEINRVEFKIDLVNFPEHLTGIIELLAKSDNDFFVQVMDACKKYNSLQRVLIGDNFLNHPLICKKLVNLYLNALIADDKCTALFVDAHKILPQRIITDPNYRTAAIEALAGAELSYFIQVMGACQRKDEAELQEALLCPQFWENTAIRKKIVRAYLDSLSLNPPCANLFFDAYEKITRKLEKHATYRATLIEIVTENINDDNFFTTLMANFRRYPRLQAVFIKPESSFLNSAAIRKKLLEIYLLDLSNGNECKTMFKDAYAFISNLIQTDLLYYSTLLEILIANNDEGFFSRVMKACKTHKALYESLFRAEFLAHPNICKKLLKCYLNALIDGNQCNEMFANAYIFISKKIMTEPLYYASILKILHDASDEYFSKVMKACQVNEELYDALFPRLLAQPSICKKMLGYYFDTLITCKNPEDMQKEPYTNITDLLETDATYRTACISLLNDRKHNDLFIAVMGTCTIESPLRRIFTSRSFLKDPRFRKLILTKYLNSFVINNKPEEMFVGAYEFLTRQIKTRPEFLMTMKEILSESSHAYFTEVMGGLRSDKHKDLHTLLILNPTTLTIPAIRKKLLRYYLDILKEKNCTTLPLYTVLTDKIKFDPTYLPVIFEIIAENDYDYLKNILNAMLEKEEGSDSYVHATLRDRLLSIQFFENPGVLEVLRRNSFMNLPTDFKVEDLAALNDPLLILLKQEKTFTVNFLKYAHKLGLCDNSVVPQTQAHERRTVSFSLEQPQIDDGTMERIDRQSYATPRKAKLTSHNTPSKTSKLRKPMHPVFKRLITKGGGLSSEALDEYLKWADKFSWIKRAIYGIIGRNRLLNWNWPLAPEDYFQGKLNQVYNGTGSKKVMIGLGGNHNQVVRFTRDIPPLDSTPATPVAASSDSPRTGAESPRARRKLQLDDSIEEQPLRTINTQIPWFTLSGFLRLIGVGSRDETAKAKQESDKGKTRNTLAVVTDEAAKNKDRLLVKEVEANPYYTIGMP